MTVRLTGTAGQSFGVWNAGGLHMYLEGDCNDYVGKGMAGGKLVIARLRAAGLRAGRPASLATPAFTAQREVACSLRVWRASVSRCVILVPTRSLRALAITAASI